MPAADARPRFPYRRLLGVAFILAGILYLLLGGPKNQSKIRYETLGEEAAPGQWLDRLVPRYDPGPVTHYSISHEGSPPLRLDTVHYQDEEGNPRSALFFPPSDAAADNGLRMDLWREAGAAITKNAKPNALFVTWWDNAQRVRFLTGSATWTDGPSEAAFTDKDALRFWEKAGGGFVPGDRNKQLANWLAMDADQAQAEMAKVLPKDQPVYFLVSLDDLARLGEIETLAGTALPFELRVFPQSDNIHTQIAAVRRWAGEKGTGSYLAQQLPQGGVRAWRITSEAGNKTFLARLLPFTSSLIKPLEHHKLIYQSRWGAYLSVYQWQL